MQTPNPSIADRARSLTLTGAERRICNVLLADYPAAGLGAVSEFARAARTSHPTVLRFVTKLGFASYGDFQQAIRGEVVDRFQTLPERYEGFRKARSGAAESDDYVAAVLGNLERAAQMASAAQVRKVARVLADERRAVYLSGSGFTYPVAAWFFNYWKQLRPAVHYVDAAARPFTYLLDLHRRDVVVLFQMPRYERDMLAFGREVVRHGSTLVLITDSPTSTLAGMATYTFASPIRVPSVFDSYLGSVLQLELITASMIQQLGDRYRDRAARLESLIPDSVKVQDLDDT
jgi:DNA-binding MurR/RpiR family transcriptional regulator